MQSGKIQARCTDRYLICQTDVKSGQLQAESCCRELASIFVSVQKEICIYSCKTASPIPLAGRQDRTQNGTVTSLKAGFAASRRRDRALNNMGILFKSCFAGGWATGSGAEQYGRIDKGFICRQLGDMIGRFTIWPYCKNLDLRAAGRGGPALCCMAIL